MARSGTDGAREELPRARAPQPFEILLILDDGAQCRLDVGFGELGLPQRDQRARPVERLCNPGQLVELETSNAADERADLVRQLDGDVGQAGGDDLVLTIDRWVVDPEVEAATLEGIVDLPRPVRGDDDGRGLVGLDGADLGNR